ncbi:DUF4402 domain-containing protein, partial [Glaciimonas sp. GG7]
VVLCAGFGVNSTAAPSTAATSATVLVPIAITKASDLAFGAFAHGAGGTVTVSTSGARTASGPILSSIGTTPTAAKFNVTGDGSSTYSVTFANTSTTLASTSTPADSMALAIFSSFSGAGATTGDVSTGGGTLASGAQSIYVGGALSVSATQVAHADYTGSVAVAVEYN